MKFIKVTQVHRNGEFGCTYLNMERILAMSSAEYCDCKVTCLELTDVILKFYVKESPEELMNMIHEEYVPF